ncbi:Hypothetical protein A7982_01119 [Minicystis rosea]|nr:Hypothetical protein A7982_01119 [Minicystis rosea]
MLVVAAILSLLIGTSLGLLGGGGSILTLPILVYVLRVEPRAAIAMSLFVVGVTSVAGAVAHARAGRVRVRAALVLGGAAMAGALAGGRIARFVPATALLVAFGAVMLVTSLAMMRGRRAALRGEPRAAKVLAAGVAVGLVAGLVGAGGGFLIVPALAIFGGLAVPEAVGTSLVVIALQSFAGFAGNEARGHLDWALTAVVSASSVAGSFLGAHAGRALSPDALRGGFAWFVLVMAVALIGKQLPASAITVVRDHLALFVAALSLVLSLVIRRGRRALASGLSEPSKTP